MQNPGSLLLLGRALVQRPAGAVVAFCAVLVIVIWASVVVQLHAERASAVSHAMHETAGFARVFEEHVLRTVRAAEFALRHVAGEYRQHGRGMNLADLVAEHGEILEPYTIFSITDERGDLILASYPFKPTNYTDRESFRYHASHDTDRIYVSKPQIGTVTGKSSVYLSRRIDKSDGTFGGVVAAGLDPSYFSQFYDQVDLGRDSVIVLIGSDGIVRARKKNDDATVGQDLNDFESFQAIKGQRAGNFVAERGLDGIRRFFAYRVLDAYPLIVQVGMSEDVMLAPYRRMRIQFVVWASLITALVGLFALLVTVQAARQERIAGALQASEARYRSFITATSRIVWRAYADGDVAEDSPTWRAYTGQTHERWCAGGWLDSVHPDDRARVVATWQTAIAEKRTYDSEYRLLGGDGIYRTFRCRAVPVLDDQSRVREWVAVLDDLSEMRKAEAAARASEGRLRTILDAEPECVVLLDPQGRVLDINAAGLAAFQAATLADMRGRPVYEYVTRDDEPVLRDIVASVFRGEGRSHTFELIAGEGACRWMDIRCVPLYDGNDGNRVVAVLGVARDITVEKRTQDQLIASRKLQQDILRSIYAFVGLFSLDGVLVEANDAPFTRGSERPLEAIGQRFWDAYWWSYSDAVRQRLIASISKAGRGEVVRYDEVMRVGEESYATVDIQFGPLRDAEGQVVQVVAFAVDITERKKAEAERAHLAHIVQTSDDAIISRTLDHIILSWNGGAERLFGYTADEIVGRELSFLIAPDCIARYMRMRGQSSSGRPPGPHENTCLAKDGRRIDVWVSASEIHDERGELVGVSLILRDIAEQKALEAQQRLAASVLESAAEGIMITDRDKNIVAVNKAFTDITGFTAEDAIGKDRRLLSSAAHPSSTYEAVWQAVSEKGQWRGEVWDRRKNGELCCELLSVTAVRDDDGQVVHYCAIMMDITQRKSAEAELQRLNAELENRVAARTRQLESANKELAAFSYSVSHDLRAPVRAIEGFSALVLGKAAGHVDGETFNRLQRIRDNAERMGLLIDDLLRLSRVSQREIDRRDFDLSALAEAVVANLRRTDARSIEVEIQREMTANADPTLVQLVMDNLVSNAWKFTGRTEHARIEVGRDESAAEPVYFVRDNGAGFDMQYAGKLFNAFQRLHHHDEFEGTGIGLSIVHRVIVKHGGRVWADARVGQGATFFFTLG